MSKQEIEITENKKRSSPKTDSKFYTFKASDKYLGFTCIKKGTSVFAWNGIVDFVGLETFALHTIPYLLSNNQLSLLPGTEVEQQTAKAIFILEANKKREYDRIIRLDILKPAQKDPYRRFLEDPDQISFARYDLEGRLGDEVYGYSLTAGSMKNESNQSEPELGVKLSPFPQRLLDWNEEFFKYAFSMNPKVAPIVDDLNLVGLVQAYRDNFGNKN